MTISQRLLLVGILVAVTPSLFAQETGDVQTTSSAEAKVEITTGMPETNAPGEARSLFQKRDPNMPSMMPPKDIKPAQLPAPRGTLKDIREIRQETAGEVKMIRQEGLGEIKDIRMEGKADIQLERMGRNADMRIIMQSSSTPPEKRALMEARLDTSQVAIEAKREAMLLQMKTERAEFQKEIEEKRAAAQKEIDTKKAELKAKVATIKDEKKKQAVTKVGASLQTVNDNIVKAMTAATVRQEEVAAKMSVSIDQLAALSLDVTAARASLSESLAGIARAKEAITVQSAKVYSVQVTTEANVKTDLSTAREAIKSDVASLKALVDGSRDMLRMTAEKISELRKTLPPPEVDVQAGASVTGN